MPIVEENSVVKTLSPRSAHGWGGQTFVHPSSTCPMQSSTLLTFTLGLGYEEGPWNLEDIRSNPIYIIFCFLLVRLWANQVT